MPVDAIIDDLNPGQQKAVTCGSGAFYVLAGPGTGKTRVLTRRAAYLARHQSVKPPSILAVTFTNKAAEELRERLAAFTTSDDSQFRVCTFHSFCLKLLRQFGDRIDLNPGFVIYDDDDQLDVLSLLLERDGETHPSHKRLSKLRDAISRVKSAGRDPAYIDTINDDAPGDNDLRNLPAIAEEYQTILRAHNAVDFDDLQRYAVRLLHDDEQTRRQVSASLRHVLVDEFHDVCPVQYELLKLIAPPGGSNVMVVADDCQSIYGWRGADPKLLQRFRQEYKATEYCLDENYRSTTQIIQISQELLGQTEQQFKRNLFTRNGIGTAVEHHIFRTLCGEHMWLDKTLHNLLAVDGLSPSDIAILYRIHSIADPTETFLSQRGYPVLRVQRDPFFKRPGIRETKRYLELLRNWSDPHFVQALNYPRVVADELTMHQLSNLALAGGKSLATVAREIDTFPQVSPVSCATISRFVTVMDSVLLPLVQNHADIGTIVKSLLHQLDLRRSPYRQEEMESLRGFIAFTSFADDIALLRRAIELKARICIWSEPDVDSACAAVIFQHALQHYLHVPSDICMETTGVPQRTAGEWPETFTIAIRQQPAGGLSADRSGMCVTPRAAGTIAYSAATIALRVCQGLLISYEDLDQQRFVVYDLETTGTQAEKDEAIEVGAVEIQKGTIGSASLHKLLRPRERYISREATQVHGLTAADLAGCPFFDEVVGELLTFMGSAFIAGHNIKKFDNRIVCRAAEKAGNLKLQNPAIDTLELAQRLFPERSGYKLDDLARDLLRKTVEHRSHSDALIEAELLLKLLEENRWQKELHTLTEMLPLVAWGMRAANVPIQDENRFLYHAALRVGSLLPPERYVDRVFKLLPPESLFDRATSLDWLTDKEVPRYREDAHWDQLRDEWLAQVKLFESVSPDHTLEAFLDHAALLADEDACGRAQNCITLMTLHNSKGKEFRTVFIIGLEDDTLPLWSNRHTPDQINEERRVLYVGMTRAKQQLYLSSVQLRDENRKRHAPTCFVLTLPRDTVKRYNHLD